MMTLKEKVFSKITNDFQVMTIEVFSQLEMIREMMDDNTNEDVYTTIKNNELIIDSLEVKIRSEVINTIVLYTPRATNLRIIIAYYDMTAYLERIGDLSLNIANFLKQADIHNELFNAFKDKLRQMLDIVVSMAKNAIKAFTDSEPELARNVIEMDDEVDRHFYEIGQELPKMYASRQLLEQELTDILAINAISYNIERIGDHSTNIAESAVYLIQGRNIQHLDHQDTADSLLNNES
ncbi:MAG: phosphate signaling complex protein PhoU [Bacteroidales bacterium]